MEKVLIAGATGTTGKIIVNLLKESQYFEPIAMIRKEEQRAQFEAQQVEARMADLENEVEQACDHIDKVIFAAGSGGKKVVAVDQEGAKKMIDASVKNKIKKFVMLSSRGADNPEEANELQEYLKAKHNADEYLKSTDLVYTIVRPGALNNEEPTDHIILTNKLSQQGEIPRADVAQVLSRVLHDDVAVRETFEILQGDTLIGKALDQKNPATA